MNPEILVGIGIGAAAISAAAIVLKLKEKGNPIEVLDVSYNKLDNRLEVNIINTSKKLYCVRESEVRQQHIRKPLRTGSMPMMSARGDPRRMYNLLAESDELLLVRPGEVQVLNFNLILPSEDTGFDINNYIEFTIRGEEIDLTEFLLEGNADVRLASRWNAIEPHTQVDPIPQEPRIKQPIKPNGISLPEVQIDEVREVYLEESAQKKANTSGDSLRYIKDLNETSFNNINSMQKILPNIMRNLNATREEQVEKSQESLSHVIKNMGLDESKISGNLLQPQYNEPVGAPHDVNHKIGVNIRESVQDEKEKKYIGKRRIELNDLRDKLIYFYSDVSPHLFTREKKGKSNEKGLFVIPRTEFRGLSIRQCLASMQLEKELNTPKALKEITFTNSITVDVDGKTFTIERLVGDIGEESQLGDGCLMEIKYNRVYGSFTEGMYHFEECWMDEEGIVFVRPEIIKSMAIKKPSESGK